MSGGRSGQAPRRDNQQQTRAQPVPPAPPVQHEFSFTPTELEGYEGYEEGSTTGGVAHHPHHSRQQTQQKQEQQQHQQRARHSPVQHSSEVMPEHLSPLQRVLSPLMAAQSAGLDQTLAI